MNKKKEKLKIGKKEWKQKRVNETELKRNIEWMNETDTNWRLMQIRKEWMEKRKRTNDPRKMEWKIEKRGWKGTMNEWTRDERERKNEKGKN